MLAVFKQIDGTWYLLYHESFWVYNASTELQVANNPSANKTFYIRCLHEYESGLYRNAYQFYKLINNKVHPCLELTSEARLYGWGSSLNQDNSSKFRFDNEVDAIWVNYKYDFFPGFEDEPGSEHINMSFAKGDGFVTYSWDAATSAYRFKSDSTPGAMNKDKITSFSRLGDDSTFVKAFNYEISKTLKESDEKQRKFLMNYLKRVRNRRTIDPPKELEEKAQIEGMKFYGPKKK